MRTYKKTQHQKKKKKKKKANNGPKKKKKPKGKEPMQRRLFKGVNRSMGMF
jgi:hypothetical protein